MRALSVRQPWAWAILYAGKDVENRDWTILSPSARNLTTIIASGETLYLHTGRTMMPQDYADACAFMMGIGVDGVPPPDDLTRGAIIGTFKIVGHSWKPNGSKWWAGPFGLHLAEAKPMPAIWCKGALGFFDTGISHVEPSRA